MRGEKKEGRITGNNSISTIVVKKSKVAYIYLDKSRNKVMTTTAVTASLKDLVLMRRWRELLHEPRESLFKYENAPLYCMKWTTREHAKVDRIACPWLIKNFVDKDAEFLFVPAHKVIQLAKEQNAIPFDVPSAEFGHHGDECSFDAILKRYHLDEKEPALLELAKIVRGADTPNRVLTPQSQGLVGIATGFSLISKDDYDNMTKQCYVYDALLAYCKSDKKGTSSRH